MLQQFYQLSNHLYLDRTYFVLRNLFIIWCLTYSVLEYLLCLDDDDVGSLKIKLEDFLFFKCQQISPKSFVQDNL